MSQVMKKTLILLFLSLKLISSGEAMACLNKGTVLLVHGLNNRPMILDELAVNLKQLNYFPVAVSLQGHTPDSKPINQVTQNDWIVDFERKLLDVRVQARLSNCPIYLLGYSLGAVVIENYFSLHPQVAREVAKIVYISPALFLRQRSINFINLVDFLGISSLPSFTPQEYKANNLLPITAYKSLFLLAQQIEQKIEKNVATPRLVIISKKDEVVDYEAINSYIEKHAALFEIITVEKDPNAKSSYNHLIVHQDDLGTALWDTTIRKIDHFFNSK